MAAPRGGRLGRGDGARLGAAWWWAFVAALAALLAVGGASIAALRATAAAQTRILDAHVAALLDAERFRSTSEQGARLAREWLVTGDPSRFDAYDASQRGRQDLLARLALEAGPDAAAPIDRLRERSSAADQRWRDLVAARQQGVPGPVVVERFEREILPLRAGIDADVAVLVRGREEALARARAAVRRDARAAVAGLAVATLGIVLAAGLLAALLRRSILAVRRGEARFRATFEHAPIGVAHLALDGTWTWMNERYAAIVGRPASELVGRRFADFTHPDDLPGDLARIAELGAGTREHYATEKRYLRRDGAVAWVRLTVSVQRDGEGRAEGFVSAAEDVTAWKAADEALREHQRMLAALLANIPGMAYRGGLDPARPMSFVSEGARALTGHPPDALVSGAVRFGDLVHADDRRRVWDELQGAVFERRPYRIAYRIADARGEERAVWDQGMAVHREDGTLLALEGLALDVTEQRAAERDREVLLDELRDALEAREEFLSVASHELRTPLTSLRLQLESLVAVLDRDAQAAPERLRGKVDAALRQSARLGGLVDGLLDVSRLGEERFAMEPEDADLGEIAAAVVARMAGDAKRHGSALRLDVSGPAPGRWDRHRLEQAVGHLLSNAVKYGAGKPVEVRVEAAGGRARLSVRDHGIGVPPEQRERIFGRFERAVSTRNYGGFGLGLFFARRIVEAHGGTIRAEGPADGATFVMELPTREPARASGAMGD